MLQGVDLQHGPKNGLELGFEPQKISETKGYPSHTAKNIRKKHVRIHNNICCRDGPATGQRFVIRLNASMVTWENPPNGAKREGSVSLPLSEVALTTSALAATDSANSFKAAFANLIASNAPAASKFDCARCKLSRNMHRHKTNKNASRHNW